MGKKANYGYLIQEDTDPKLADQSGDSFKIARGAQLIETNQPDRKAMRYMGKGDESSFDVTKAGAGRGGQGGPTAAQARQNRGMMSDAEKAARDEAKEMKEQKATEKAYEASRTSMKKGGMTASARADGIAQRGKTRGTIVMCGGGMYKK